MSRPSIVVAVLSGLAFVAPLGGCVSAGPIAAPAPRTAITVLASIDKTWSAAVRILADRGVAIKTADRPSGTIVTEVIPISLGGSGALGDSLSHMIVDCGSPAIGRRTLYPTAAQLQIFIQGNALASTVLARVRYWRTGPSRSVSVAGVEAVTEECATAGGLEKEYEVSILKRAER